MTELLLISMFRSGSTTLARALNAHKEIAFASDPYLEIFKCLRSDIAEDLGIKTLFSHPLDDYYFSPEGNSLLRDIEVAKPERIFNAENWEMLMPVLEKRCMAYSANLTPYLQNIMGNTYQEIFSLGLAQIAKCYGDEQTKVTGFKEVWGIEFVPFFLNMFPNGKTIILQRDPRAVCASKNKTQEKYPWIFLCRQWRKIAALGWYFSQHEKYKNNVLVLRFEDFLANPNKITKKICDFLDIAWDVNIANPESYKGGGGEVWKQNTSFGSGEAKFDTNATQRWRKSLSREECAYIEYMCGPEMQLFGYEAIETQPEERDYWVSSSPRIDDEDQANWMKPIVSNRADILIQQMKLEMIRYDLLLEYQSKNKTLEESFLKERVFTEIKKLYQHNR